MAVYTSSGLDRYWHGDWLGSVRLVTSAGRALDFDTALAPYGERYASSSPGPVAYAFTGQPQDTSSPLYDFPFREYDQTQGRWISPDPAGLGAVDPTNPQSLNRYAYVGNKPLSLVDPSGLCAGQAEGLPCGPEYQPALGPGVDEFDLVFSSGLSYYATYFSNGTVNPNSGLVDPEDPFSTSINPGVAAALASLPGAGSVPGPGGDIATLPLPSLKDLLMVPTTTRCVGEGRGLSGNTALVGRQGGIPGQTVQPGTVAVIPQQFGVPTGAAFAPYAGNIFGVIGSAPFSAATDVIGGRSPIPGVNVRTALQRIYPGQLILEIPGAADQGANAPVTISVPQELGCPAGTGPAGGG